MNSDVVSLSLDKRTYTLRLCLEPCNEIGTRMLTALEGAVAELDTDAADALIITSELPRGFCAGADLRELYQGLVEADASEVRPTVGAFIARVHSLFDTIDRLPLTTVAAVHGVCFGGGFELALTCDVVVADRSARFCFPELRLGLIPGFGGIPRLRRDAGEAAIRDLILTGRSIGARRAHELGWVAHSVARGESLSAARAIATQASRFDPMARARAKAFCKTFPEHALARERETFLDMITRPAVREGLRRFVTHEGPMPYLPTGAP